MSRAAKDSTPPLVRGVWVSGGAVTDSASTASMILAIVLTAMIGYLPTEVSPDSITASAPSSTALATSEASARVGRECSIIESSIWVATITGLGVLPGDLHRPLLHQRHLLQRQLDAEIAAGDHDPVERAHDGLEIGDRFRLLELGDDRQPRCADLVHHVRAPGRRRTATGRTTAR